MRTYWDFLFPWINQIDWRLPYFDLESKLKSVMICFKHIFHKKVDLAQAWLIFILLEIQETKLNDNLFSLVMRLLFIYLISSANFHLHYINEIIRTSKTISTRTEKIVLLHTPLWTQHSIKASVLMTIADSLSCQVHIINIIM